MADEPLRQFPEGSLGREIQKLFREASKDAFEGISGDPTNAELKSAIGALWDATERAFEVLVLRAGNPPSSPSGDG